MADWKPGDRAVYIDDYDNEHPATVVKVSEPWTTGMEPIKVRLKGGREVWTYAGRLS